MLAFYHSTMVWFKDHPIVFTITCFTCLIIIAWIANFIVKRILVRGITKLLNVTLLGKDDVLSKYNVISRLSNVVPAVILSVGVNIIPGLPKPFINVISNVCTAFITLTLALAIGNVLDIINILWQKRPDAANRPIKGYLQIIKIFIYAVCAILMMAALIDKSPVILLSGLGAMAAVLMLIFQDTLLSLVASVQISSNQTIRLGDWVEMPQVNADGDVIDIALHSVRIQNWDKSITTIPTKKFLTDSFKNWRGMQECGGRRIKRSLFLDQNSVHFLTEAEEHRFRSFKILEDYLTQKDKELQDWNEKLGQVNELNYRRITNIGTFRAYVEKYLRNNPHIRQDMTLIVRQMAPTSEGLPLEIYCFTNDTRWAFFESIQSDIFDHLFAIIPEFGLHVFQNPSGTDVISYRELDNK